jgi:hypothetical protein
MKAADWRSAFPLATPVYRGRRGISTAEALNKLLTQAEPFTSADAQADGLANAKCWLFLLANAPRSHWAPFGQPRVEASALSWE